MAGRHPGTGEQLLEAVLRIDPRAKILAAPLSGALRRAAQHRGVGVAELMPTAELRAGVNPLKPWRRPYATAALNRAVDARPFSMT
ncbi:hypothetical protein GCM10010517_15990 [Streptosporangium fragile]|uniref:Uncharacterized protein n=1 Tax=Streptosporangium fragile TaxID=46186 RepID=A0ABN3VTD5_9ACTN